MLTVGLPHSLADSEHAACLAAAGFRLQFLPNGGTINQRGEDYGPENLDVIVCPAQGWERYVEGRHSATCGLIALGQAASAASGSWQPDLYLAQDVPPEVLVAACELVAKSSRVSARNLRQRLLIEALRRRLRTVAGVARLDPLTGLPNLRGWRRDVARRYWALAAGRRNFAMAILDLDGFKSINDVLGHVVGDQVLIETARSLVAAVAGDGFLARLGGDEFGLLVSCTGPNDARQLVEDARAAMVAPAPGDDLPPLSACAGYALANAHESPTALFAAADLALRHAKHDGRGRVVLGS